MTFDLIRRVAAIGFVGAGIYSVAAMFYIIKHYDSSMSGAELLRRIPRWVKLLGIISAVIFLCAIVVAGILRPKNATSRILVWV